MTATIERMPFAFRLTLATLIIGVYLFLPALAYWFAVVRHLRDVQSIWALMAGCQAYWLGYGLWVEGIIHHPVFVAWRRILRIRRDA